MMQMQRSNLIFSHVFLKEPSREDDAAIARALALGLRDRRRAQEVRGP